MNKITEYFENLDKKNMIMLILSVLIICFIAVYYLNEYFSSQENKILSKKIKLVKKIRELSIINDKILKIKKRNKELKTVYVNLNSDLKYILSLIDSSFVLKTDDKKFLKILHSYINIGTNVNASFDINETKSLKKYILKIVGVFYADKFFNFTNFLKQIETPKAIITVDDINLSKKKNKIDYKINVTIWGFE